VFEAAGFVEEDREGVHRLLVGTSREALNEYIRVID
jgi:predicted nucleotidyltransferase